MRGRAVGVAGRKSPRSEKVFRNPDWIVLTCFLFLGNFVCRPVHIGRGVMTAHDDVAKLTVAKLRDALKKKGLDTTGLKAALVARLQESLQSVWGDDVKAPSPKSSPSRASKRKRDSMSEPAPAPAPEPEPVPAVEPAPEPAPAPEPTPPPAPETTPPPAKKNKTVAPDVRPPSPPLETRAPTSGLDARAAAISALTTELKDEQDEEQGAAATKRTTTQTSQECPYLDTVNRALLDFDFEKCCSVSLSPHNVYACLVCGKYFQGRGKDTHAYTHSLEHGHHVFLRLDDGKAYCLPDLYEIANDQSLDDVRAVLDPKFTTQNAQNTDTTKQWRLGLDGKEYLTGTIGLNNLSSTDYLNCVLQCVTKVGPLRRFFLNKTEVHERIKKRVGMLTLRFGELLRKMWNPRAFKGQVSPHEFVRAVVKGSESRFKVDTQSDPVEFFQWLLHALGRETKSGGKSIIDQCFTGEMEVLTVGEPPVEGGADATSGVKSQAVPFKMLALDLPPPPLFQDAMEKNIIPQISVNELLRKYDGVSTAPTQNGGLRTYRLTNLPTYLIVHYKRFTTNQFFREKNPTIVTFPTKTALRLSDVVPVPVDGKTGVCEVSSYDLIANICHDGTPDAGTYRAQVFHKSDGNWYDMRDLSVEEVLPQQVALTETYMQIWERRAEDAKPAPKEEEEDIFGLGDLGGDTMEA